MLTLTRIRALICEARGKLAASTSGEWYTQGISDCVRIVLGTGRKRIIIARLASPQIPEQQTADNAHLIVFAHNQLGELCDALEETARVIENAQALAGAVERYFEQRNLWSGSALALNEEVLKTLASTILSIEPESADAVSDRIRAALSRV